VAEGQQASKAARIGIAVWLNSSSCRVKAIAPRELIEKKWQAHKKIDVAFSISFGANKD
jgi:hypothetical protein